MTYFVFTCDEDGLDVESMSADTLAERLNNEDFDSPVFVESVEEIREGHLPNCVNGNPVLIIKGDVVVPKPVQVVREWVVPAD